MRCWIAVMVSCLTFSVPAKTRWSSIQYIPNADLIPAGRFLVDANLFWAMDTFNFTSPVSVQRLEMGLSEWLNFDVGYAGGLTMGFKTCVVRETSGFVPTVTLGVQNLFTNKETGYFGEHRDYPANEVFLAFAKSMDVIRLRITLGALSAPSSENDVFNPFFGFEKYFGSNLYMSLESQMRSRRLSFSLFSSWRPVRDRLEINVGIIDLERAFASSYAESMIKPGLKVGIRVNLGSGLNSVDGLTGIEDRIDWQNQRLSSLESRIDSLKKEVVWNSKRISDRSAYPKEYLEERAYVLDELTKLSNSYNQEPFDPQNVRSSVDLILEQREKFAPHLRAIVTDVNLDWQVRTLAVTMLGELKDRNAVGILIGLLERPGNAAMKIEAMIALGKMEESGAADVLKKLVDDSDNGVAFTALEILKELKRVTGDEESPDSAPEPVTEVPERPVSPDVSPDTDPLEADSQ
ncbi:MAG: HEAT repeat domain-containing protein [Fibrobacterota bacterium]